MTRKTVVRLPLETKCALAKFALENKNVLLSGETFVYRTNREMAIKEAKEAKVFANDLQLTANHLTDAMETYLAVLKITTNLPKVQATVQEDILVAELKKKDQVIASLTTQLAGFKKTLEVHMSNIQATINKIVPA